MSEKKVYILPYNYGSKSVKRLKELCPEWIIPKKYGTKELRPDAVINWGCSDTGWFFNRVENPLACVDLNFSTYVSIWSNKLYAYEYMQRNLSEEEQSLFIEQTTSQAEAQRWSDNGSDVVVRTLTRASNGRGIIIIDAGGVVPLAPLYSKYQKKKHEYRVHVGYSSKDDDCHILAVQKKAKKRGVEYADTRIRNAHQANDVGWVFLSQDVSDVASAVLDTAKEALKLSGLDFAGLDVIYNEYHDRAWVVEINTAPGIGEKDAQAYVEFFKGEFE